MLKGIIWRIKEPFLYKTPVVVNCSQLLTANAHAGACAHNP